MKITGVELIIVGVVVVAALYVGGYLHTTPVPQGATGGSTNVSVSTTAPTLNLIAYYPNSLANNGQGGLSSVSTNAIIYLPGSTSALVPSVTVAGSYNSAGSGAINGGTNYNVFCGDNGNYYLNRTTIGAQAGKSTPTQCIVFLVSAPTLTFKNATSAGFSVSGGQVRSVNAGQAITGSLIQIQVAAGAGFFGYPGEGYAIDFSANSAIVGSISSMQCLSGCGGISNLPQVSTSVLPTESTYTNNFNVAFAAPSVNGYQSQVFSIQGTLGSSVSDDAYAGNFQSTQNALGVYLVPAVNYNYNGQFLTSVYVKPGVSGSVAAGAVTSNSVGIGFTSHA